MRFFGNIAILSLAGTGLVQANRRNPAAALNAVAKLANKAKPVVKDITEVMDEIISSDAYHNFIDNSMRINASGVERYLSSIDTVIRGLLGKKAANNILEFLGGSSVSGASEAVAEDLSDMQRIMRFIAQSKTSVEAMQRTMATISDEIKASDLNGATNTFKTQFLPEIAQLTNNAIAAIPDDKSVYADQWRDALVTINSQAINFSKTQITAATLETFMDNMVVLIGKLTGLSDLAQEVVAVNASSSPAVGATTKDLQIQAAVVATQCVCATGFSFLRYCCSSKAAVSNVVDPSATAPVVATNSTAVAVDAVAPTNLSDGVEKAIKFATFVDDTIHTIKSLLRQLKKIGKDKEAFVNFQWRVAVTFLQFLNNAALDNDFVEVYDILRNHGSSILATLAKAATESDLSNAETIVTAVLNQLQTQLQAVAPKNV